MDIKKSMHTAKGINSVKQALKVGLLFGIMANSSNIYAQEKQNSVFNEVENPTYVDEIRNSERDRIEKDKLTELARRNDKISIYVSKAIPETLYLIEDKRIVFESLANTGIKASPTKDGEYRIFSSYLTKNMVGVDPISKKKYIDKNVPYPMYFNNGDAIHGFIRKGYGYPQSFGCVELPIKKAAELYSLVDGGIGVKVVISNSEPEQQKKVDVLLKQYREFSNQLNREINVIEDLEFESRSIQSEYRSIEHFPINSIVRIKIDRDIEVNTDRDTAILSYKEELEDLAKKVTNAEDKYTALKKSETVIIRQVENLSEVAKIPKLDKTLH